MSTFEIDTTIIKSDYFQFVLLNCTKNYIHMFPDTLLKILYLIYNIIKRVWL